MKKKSPFVDHCDRRCCAHRICGFALMEDPGTEDIHEDAYEDTQGDAPVNTRENRKMKTAILR